MPAALGFMSWSAAKDTVKISFIGPLTGGVAANGIEGRNSADLAVKLRNEDPKAKYTYQLVALDDECKPKMSACRWARRTPPITASWPA